MLTTVPTQIDELVDQPVLSVRARVPKREADAFIGEALEDVRSFMHEHHVLPAGPPFWVSLTDGDEVDIEAGWPLCEPVDGCGRIHSGAMPQAALRTRG